MTTKSRKQPLTDEQKRESEKLKAIYEEKSKKLGVTQEIIAAAMRGGGESITQGAISHFMNKRLALHPKAASVFARLLEVPVSEFAPRLARAIEDMERSLAAGLGASNSTSSAVDGFDPADYDMILQSTAKLAAGHGEQNTHVDVDRALAFKKTWIKRKRLIPSKLIVVYASGSSMFPIIQDGDAVLINTADTALKHDRIFAFKDGNHEDIIKRAIEDDGVWLLRSDNPDKSVKEHQDMSFVDDHGQQRFEVVGAARWRGGDL